MCPSVGVCGALFGEDGGGLLGTGVEGERGIRGDVPIRHHKSPQLIVTILEVIYIRNKILCGMTL